MRDENDKTERLFNDEISYKFLFMCVVTAVDCPVEWKQNQIRQQPLSIYESKLPQIQGQITMQLVNELLDLPELAGGKVDKAFDELF